VKARVSLARAAYSQSEIVILDDPLSAVDAYVGKYILDHCLLEGPLANRTRILVTHSLHVLDKVDYIYVMDNGAIVEQGTYSVRITRMDAITFYLLLLSSPESNVEWPCILTFDRRLRKC
jgi:ABC-type bacteriocin/lantibiotic exporter with double-glycine peptidase domain